MSTTSRTLSLATLLSFAVALLSGNVRADEPKTDALKTAPQWIAHFTKSWDAKAWGPSQKRGYMRASDNDDWQQRMLAMHSLVKGGKDSIPSLVAALHSDDTPTRILAAQTLGYLSPSVPREALQRTIENDRSAAARLYAIDSLGMRGGRELREYFETRTGKETNRDVRRHMGYAIERKTEGIARAIGESLIGWDPKQINTAKVGSLAPDFQLSTVSGKKIRLSDYLGQQAVVLVFIYGDT